MKDFIKKYNEFILFTILGILTSLVSYITYYIFSYMCNINYLISNALSWIVTVLFAFFSNRRYVFKKKGKENLLRELFFFGYGRVFTAIVEMFLLFLCVDIGNYNDLISKFLIGFFTAILNYFISKLLIFKKR